MPEFAITHLPPNWTAADIQAALDQFAAVYNRAPTSLAVHPINIPRIERALIDLHLLLPLQTNPGAFVSELWLQTNDGRRRAGARNA